MGRGIPDKRSSIIRAAIQRFSATHFHTTTIPEIAKLAGVGEGTIYHYFKHKKHLAERAYVESLKALVKELKEGYPAVGKPRQKLHHLAVAMLRKMEKEAVLFNFLFFMRPTDYMDAAAAMRANDLMRLIVDTVDDGRRHGELRPLPSRVLAALYFGVIREAMRLRVQGHIRKSLTAFTEEIAGAAWNAIVKR